MRTLHLWKVMQVKHPQSYGSLYTIFLWCFSWNGWCSMARLDPGAHQKTAAWHPARGLPQTSYTTQRFLPGIFSPSVGSSDFKLSTGFMQAGGGGVTWWPETGMEKLVGEGVSARPQQKSTNWNHHLKQGRKSFNMENHHWDLCCYCNHGTKPERGHGFHGKLFSYRRARTQNNMIDATEVAAMPDVYWAWIRMQEVVYVARGHLEVQ